MRVGEPLWKRLIVDLFSENRTRTLSVRNKVVTLANLIIIIGDLGDHKIIIIIKHIKNWYRLKISITTGITPQFREQDIRQFPEEIGGSLP